MMIKNCHFCGYYNRLIKALPEVDGYCNQLVKALPEVDGYCNC